MILGTVFLFGGGVTVRIWFDLSATLSDGIYLISKISDL